ncbi:MAG: GNAT family N-acetyltransferase [Sphingobium sp.]
MPVAREYRSIAEALDAIGGRLDRARAGWLFEQADWFALLHAHCMADRQPRIVRAIEGDAEAWLFLIEDGDGRLSAMANWYSFDWGPIFLGEPDAAAQARLLSVIAKSLMRGVAQIDLYPVEAPQPILSAFRRAGWFAVQRPMGGRYRIDLGDRDFAAYWEGRPGRLRETVRRKGRGAPFVLEVGTVLTDALWRDYVDVHARSWKDAEPCLDFLHALASRESAAGTLRLGFARKDGRAVAAQFWSVEKSVALIHKLSHDAAFDRASPGTLLAHAMFAHVIDRDGARVIDYGTGDNGYKAAWMDERRPLMRVDCFNPRAPSSWLPAARTAISALVG